MYESKREMPRASDWKERTEIEVTALAFAPNGKRMASVSGVSGSADMLVKFWDVETGADQRFCKAVSTQRTSTVF
jgi:WD40 repeat protein